MKNLLISSLVAISVMFSAIWCVAEEGHICFSVIDADNDNKVTIQEYAKIFGNDKEKFDLIDKDGNGYLSHDEYHVVVGHGAS